jgi:hypothetical protein
MSEATSLDSDPRTELLPYTMKLTKPVDVLGASVSEFSLREPSGMDMSMAGSPIKLGPDGVDINAPRMTAMIARLAGVPDTAVQQMRGADWNRCAMRIAGFLLAGVAETD